MSTPFRATINFFQHVVMCIAKIMGLLHANQAQKKVRYFIETLISIRNLILTSLVPKIFVNCAMTSWRRRLNVSNCPSIDFTSTILLTGM